MSQHRKGGGGKYRRSNTDTEFPNESPPSLNNAAYAHFKNRHKKTLMQVVKTKLRCPEGGVVEVSVLFDGGNGRSFITSSLARELQLRKSGGKWFAFSGFGGTGTGRRAKKENIFP